MSRILVLLMAMVIAGCSGGGQWQFVDDPQVEVTQLLVNKAERKLYLLNGQKAIKVYDIDLGFEPTGHKTVRGDGRTPEGLYYIDRRNYFSDFHLSLGISYPNRADWDRAREIGEHPGGDIFIHGEDPDGNSGRDWTAGCIAVTNEDMEEIFSMVRNGTPIYITALEPDADDPVEELQQRLTDFLNQARGREPLGEG